MQGQCLGAAVCTACSAGCLFTRLKACLWHASWDKCTQPSQHVKSNPVYAGWGMPGVTDLAWSEVLQVMKGGPCTTLCKQHRHRLLGHSVPTQ
jgi:hypothetical protein